VLATGLQEQKCIVWLTKKKWLSWSCNKTYNLVQSKILCCLNHAHNEKQIQGRHFMKTIGGQSCLRCLRLRSPGALAPRCEARGRAGGGCGRGSSPPATGVRGYNPRKNFEITGAHRWVLTHSDK
jgi:hypothetical protein